MYHHRSRPILSPRVLSRSQTPERCRDVLRQAGFTDIVLQESGIELVFGEGDGLRQNVEELVRVGPIGRLLAEQEPAVLALALDSITESLAPYYRDDALHLPGSVWFVQAAAG